MSVTRGGRLDITFYGVRGSTPCSGHSVQRYGGNTACVALERPGRDPIVFDLGTGLRYFGVDRAHEQPFSGHALLSHLHWDHVQGIPFFAPLLAPGGRLVIHGPAQDHAPLEDMMRTFLSPPYFPVDLDCLPCEVEFREVEPGSFEIDDATVVAASVPHVGPTLGFRVSCEGMSVAYVSDHQQPGVGSTDVAPDVLELCEGADLLIHDAQYDDLEFSMRSDWGHCTVDYALEVAAQAGVRTLALYHHDPSHSDAHIDGLLDGLQERAAARGVSEVIAAHEGLTVSLAGARAEAERR